VYSASSSRLGMDRSVPARQDLLAMVLSVSAP
jgi:hypothetical protein